MVKPTNKTISLAVEVTAKRNGHMYHYVLHPEYRLFNIEHADEISDIQVMFGPYFDDADSYFIEQKNIPIEYSLLDWAYDFDELYFNQSAKAKIEQQLTDAFKQSDLTIKIFRAEFNK